jgi:copper oxidase (laccase) domain-containing protein
MVGLGARPGQVGALVGPGICPEHYEVPAAMQAEVAATAPAAAAVTSRGTPALDIRAGLVEQLRAAGIGSWSTLPQCTAETPDCYSFRRDGVTGRFAGIVWIRP